MIFSVALMVAIAEPDRDLCGSTSSADLTECAARSMKDAEADLTAELKHVRAWMVQHSNKDTYSMSAFRRLFEASHAAWVKYRDAQCDVDHMWWTGGNLQMMSYYGCRGQLAKERIDKLCPIHHYDDDFCEQDSETDRLVVAKRKQSPN